MRKIATVPKTYSSDIVRLMLYQEENGVYLFGYNTSDDSNSLWDEWYENVADAEAAAQESYDVTIEMWQIIDDPLKGCQHDWVAPVRIARHKNGYPSGQSEKLVDGIWRPFPF